MFNTTTQQLRERMRGFEEELDELDRVMTIEPDVQTSRELDRLLPEVRSIFASREDAAAYDRLAHVLTGLKLDPEKMIPLLSVRLLQEDESVLEHLLRSQNAAMPRRREELARVRREGEARAWNVAFRAAGLDGKGLMELMGMKPGRELGELLRGVQVFAKGESDLPDGFDAKTRAEVISRVKEARDRIGVSGSLAAIAA